MKYKLLAVFCSLSILAAFLVSSGNAYANNDRTDVNRLMVDTPPPTRIAEPVQTDADTSTGMHPQLQRDVQDVNTNDNVNPE